MDKKDLIQTAVDDYLEAAVLGEDFTPEIMAKVDNIIKKRIEYYQEYFKDDPQAREFAEHFSPGQIARIATHQKYHEPSISHKEDCYLLNRYLREREYIIKYFYEPGLTYEQIKAKYWEDRFNNPRKYNLTDTHKKRILKDWAKHFPEMLPFKSKYTFHKLFKIVGPFVFGIVLQRDKDEEYTPLISINHLLLPMHESGLFAGHIKSDSHHFWNVKVIDHYQGFYTDAIEIMKERFWLPIEGDVTLEQICEFKEFSAPEIKALFFAWAGKRDLAMHFRDEELKLLRDSKNRYPEGFFCNMSPKERKHLKYFYGTELSPYQNNGIRHMKLFTSEYDPDNAGEAWEQKFVEMIDNPDLIREIVRNNIKNRVELGLNIAPYQDIKGAPYQELSSR